MRKKRLIVGAAVIAAVVAVIVLVWFQPQKLVIDKEVSEEVPGAASEPEAAAPDEPSTGGSKEDKAGTLETVSSGRFIPLEHAAAGTALVLRSDDGKRFLRFERFRVENGPDLRVYLSSASAAEEDAHDDDFVDLGGLKGNVGDQNYEIPPGVDLARYRTAVVWCRRFSVGFAAANLGSSG